MQTETPNSTKPSKSLPERHQPHPRRRHRKPQAPRVPNKPHAFRHEISCGGIIYRKRGGTTEIFFIKDPFQRWTFPKGHPEPGEKLEQAAVRESYEEAGLQNLKVITAVGKTSFRFRRQGTVILKTVHFFLLEAPPDAKERFMTREELQPGKEPIFEGKWVRMSDVFSVSSYKNSDKLLATAMRMIADQNRRSATA